MMDDDGLSSSTTPRHNAVYQFFARLSQVYQSQLDRLTPHTRLRWSGTVVLILLFLLRIFTKQGWYIVTYALGIYHLNLFIAFLTPKIDPELDLGDNDDGPELPTHTSTSTKGEFRPFMRRLPEFKFWLSVTKSTIIGTVCTFFEIFNVPVFWPILVMYFFTLFGITMNRQIKHMIKYRYIPFTHGKPRYRRIETTQVQQQ